MSALSEVNLDRGLLRLLLVVDGRVQCVLLQLYHVRRLICVEIERGQVVGRLNLDVDGMGCIM